MPEHLKTLVVILALATIVFVTAKTPACALASAPEDFRRRRNLWFLITIAVFLAHNFWIYILFTTFLLIFSLPKESNRLAMFFFVLFAAPPFFANIAGFAGIKTIFAIDYLRLLALVVLLPTSLLISRQPDTERFGRSLPDKLLAGYIILLILLTLNASTFTHALRSAFLFTIDIFLPYYVASRSLKNLQDYRDALMAFAIAALILGATAIFEYARHWLLYSPLDDALGINWGYGNYMARGGALRATGSVGHPIVLGYVLAVALGFFLYLRKLAPNTTVRTLGLLLLAAGLLASQSRGPWIGAGAIFLVFAITGRAAARNLVKLGTLALLITPVLLLSPAGELIIDHLPFIGTYTDASIIYRQQLLEITINVILDNPLFGASNFMLSPQMQELRQGEGIIDIVNTYIGIALTSGLVGLSLFSGFFVAVAFGIFKSMKSLTEKDGELYLLGQTLLAVLIGILITIATVSSISVIAIVYWTVAGLGAGYIGLVSQTNRSRKEAPRTAKTSRPYRPAMGSQH